MMSIENPRFRSENHEPSRDAIPLEMYTISGQDQITLRSFERYRNDKINYDQIIRKLAEGGDIEDRKEMENISPSESEPAIQERDPIGDIPQQLHLDFDPFDAEALRAAQEMEFVQEDTSKTTSNAERAAQIKEALTTMTQRFNRTTTDPFALTSEEIESLEQTASPAIKEGLRMQDLEIQKMAASLIRYAPENERMSLIYDAMESNTVEVKKISARMAEYISPQDCLSLAEWALDHPDKNVQEAAMQMIEFVPSLNRAHLVLMALDKEDVVVQRAAIFEIQELPAEEKASIISVALGKEDGQVQKTAASFIPFLGKEERPLLEKELIEIIERNLNGKDTEGQKSAVELIQFIPEVERSDLISKSLRSDNSEVQKAAVRMIDYTPAEDREGFVQFVIDAHLGNELVVPPLYGESTLQSNKFGRELFPKTGSTTTLVGGKLKNKAIIRRIKPAAFLAWQSAYENYQLWQEKGFDYVPVEPIMAYRLNKEGSVDTATGVLDLSLDKWLNKTNLFKIELEKQKERIKNVITQAGIQHGHPWDGNFCLRFFRQENGDVDFTKVPRLYLIDFDQSVSSS